MPDSEDPPPQIAEKIRERVLDQLNDGWGYQNYLRYLLKHVNKDVTSRQLLKDKILTATDRLEQQKECGKLKQHAKPFFQKHSEEFVEDGWTIVQSTRRRQFGLLYRRIKEHKHAEEPKRQVFPQSHSIGVGGSDDSVRLFWKPYIESNKPTKFVFAEPLFFRNLSNESTYIRHTSVNSDNAEHTPSALAYLRDKSTPRSPLKLDSCHTFVPAGTVNAMFSLISCLQEHGTKFTSASAHRGQYINLDEDVILLGTPGTHPDIDDAEESFNFQTTNKGVVFMRGTKREEIFTDDEWERPVGDKYVVVTRTWSGDHPERAITVIATSRLSRAIERVALRLTQRQHLGELLKKLSEKKGVQESDVVGCPSTFQALYRVHFFKRRRRGDPLVGKDFLQRVEVY